MSLQRILLIVVAILLAVGLIGGTVWFLRSRSVDGGLPTLNPSRPSVGSVADPEANNPKYQAAPDTPPVPEWKEGDKPLSDDTPPELQQPPYTDPAVTPPPTP